jgi:hypothetical protein
MLQLVIHDAEEGYLSEHALEELCIFARHAGEIACESGRARNSHISSVGPGREHCCEVHCEASPGAREIARGYEMQ